ncbi:MAG: acyltransferase family protein [Hyphomicrobiales bacterium]
MNYRAEIDGLRAIAVLPVMLFHAGIEIFSGGFVGVDVFFVISGYLITTIITSEMERTQFSIVRFYERRARRILPALLFVVLMCIPFAWIWLSPNDMRDFSRSLIAVLTFSSNIYFMDDVGYFDSAAELKPLLHTWSLAVEEQYYIIFPIFISVIWVYGVRVVLFVISFIFILSIILAHWMVYIYPTESFFLLPTRGWEILMGSLCALYLSFGSKSRGLYDEFLSMFGFILICFAIFGFDRATPTPSFYILVPTIGTCLIILFANDETLVRKILSHKVLVGIGLVSFSAYLWHQPMFAFARLQPFVRGDDFLMLGLIALCFVMAFLSWHFVEQPFRSKRVPITTVFFVFLTLIATGAAMSFAILGRETDGFEARFRDVPGYEKIISVNEKWNDTSTCSIMNYSDYLEAGFKARVAKCFFPGKTIYLIGDSHAQSLAKSIRELLLRHGFQLTAMTHRGCLPIPGTMRLPSREDCSNFNSMLDEILVEYPAPLILSSRWRLHLLGTRYNNGEGGVEYRGDVATVVEGNSEIGLIEYTEQKIREFSDLNPVIVVDQIPEAGWNVVDRMLVTRKLMGANGPIDTSYDTYFEQNEEINAMFAELERTENIGVVHTAPMICDVFSGRCANEQDGYPLYRDDNHPSELFSSKISKGILDELGVLLPSTR